MAASSELKLTNDRLLSAEILLQGIGILISWNAMLAALDWYNNSFPNSNPEFWLPLLKFLPAIILQPLTIIYGHKVTFNIRIITSYIVNVIILGFTPIIVKFANETLGFIIICACTFISGSVNSVCQTSVFGLVGTLSNKYINYAMFGNGLSGLLTASLRLICLWIFQQNPKGYLHSTELYFAVSGVVLILCVIAQLHLMKHKLVIESLSKTYSKEGACVEIYPLNNYDALSLKEGSKEKEKEEKGEEGKEKEKEKEKEKINYIELMKNIWQYFFLIWINFVITFGVLSHVAFATESR